MGRVRRSCNCPILGWLHLTHTVSWCPYKNITIADQWKKNSIPNSQRVPWFFNKWLCFAEHSHNLPSCKYTYRKCIFYDTLYSCTWASSSHHSWQGYWASSSMANLVRLTLQVCTSEWNKQKTEAFNTGSYVAFGGKFTSCCETTCHLVHLLWNLLTQLALFYVVHHHVSLTSLLLSDDNGFWPSKFHL